MVQMAGVIVLALGLPQMFASIDHGDTLDNGVMVAGYVIMRVPVVLLWWKVGRHDPARRPATRVLIRSIGAAQVGWIALAAAELPVATTFALMSVLYAIELIGPYVGMHRAPIPWHAHHIAERYGLLVIITLGEVILGTVAAISAVVDGEHGWTLDAALLTVAGVGLAFGSWWMYFAVPWGDALAQHRERGFQFGHGHLFLFGSLAAVGAGLHTAALRLEGEAVIGATATVATVVVPFALFVLSFYFVYSLVMRTKDPFHLVLLAATIAVLLGALALSAAGVSMLVCLLVVMLAPVVTVVGYETIGHRHIAEALNGGRSA